MSEKSKSGKLGRTLLAAVLGIMLVAETQAGVLKGVIKDTTGNAVNGAIVTLTSGSGIGESVYTDKQGGYRLSTGLAGDLTLRIRKRYYRDDSRSLQLAATARMEINAKLTPLTDPQGLSDDHPSLSHFSMIDFDEDETGLFSGGNFTRDCLTCHSLGNSFTRGVRPAEFWVPSVQRMHGYLASWSRPLTA